MGSQNYGYELIPAIVTALVNKAPTVMGRPTLARPFKHSKQPSGLEYELQSKTSKVAFEMAFVTS